MPVRRDLRFDLLPALVILLGFAFSGWGLLHLATDNEDVLRWLPDSSAAREDFEFFREAFSFDDTMVVSWPGCTTDDGRLDEFCDHVRRAQDQGLIHRVTSGRDILAASAAAGRGVSPEQLQRRLAGVFFGRDAPERTCAAIVLGPAGRSDRAAAVRVVRQAAEATGGLESADLMVAGYPWLAVAMSRQIEQTFVRLLPLSAVFATLVALWCVRDLRLAILGLIASGLAAGFSIAIVPACGARIGGLTMIVPTLAFVLTKSGALHLTRYALDRIGDWRSLLAVGWQPCTVSALTTVIGVLTLLRSDYPAVREFGLFSAGSLLFSLVVQLVVYPWLLVRFGQGGLRCLAARAGAETGWRRTGEWVSRWQWPLVTGTALLSAWSITGVIRLRPDVEAENLFRRNSPELVAIRQLEEQIGPMDQTELLLVFPHADADGVHQRLEYVRQLDAVLSRIRTVGAVHSLADYLPREPRGGGLLNRARQTTFRQMLAAHRDELGGEGLLSLKGGDEIWRISLRFRFSDSTDFAGLEEAVRAVAGQFGDRAAGSWADFQPPRLVYTGTTQLVQVSQQALLGNFASNFLLALALITPVLIVVLRSILLGLIAMAANLLPVLFVFAWMGWGRVPIDIALGMTASVALGIAVDDTTHLMIRFRELGGSLRTVQPALSRTLGICGPAMLHTTLIACAGIGSFWLSELVVISRFAAAVCALLAAALIADLFLLPAALGVAGSFRERSGDRSAQEPAPRGQARRSAGAQDGASVAAQASVDSGEPPGFAP